MRSRRNPEENIHRAIVLHLRARGNREVLWFHSPNGGGRSKAEAGILKAMGVLPGVHDLIFLMPDCRLFSLELKAPGKKPTAMQRDFGFHIERCGFDWDWADNLDRALEILEAWGVLRPDRARGTNSAIRGEDLFEGEA